MASRFNGATTSRDLTNHTRVFSQKRSLMQWLPGALLRRCLHFRLVDSGQTRSSVKKFQTSPTKRTWKTTPFFTKPFSNSTPMVCSSSKTYQSQQNLCHALCSASDLSRIPSMVKLGTYAPSPKQRTSHTPAKIWASTWISCTWSSHRICNSCIAFVHPLLVVQASLPIASKRFQSCSIQTKTRSATWRCA